MSVLIPKMHGMKMKDVQISVQESSKTGRLEEDSRGGFAWDEKSFWELFAFSKSLGRINRTTDLSA